jgi:hypothetical protein
VLHRPTDPRILSHDLFAIPILRAKPLRGLKNKVEKIFSFIVNDECTKKVYRYFPIYPGDKFSVQQAEKREESFKWTHSHNVNFFFLL